MNFSPSCSWFYLCKQNWSSLWCYSHIVVGAHNFLPFYSWYHFVYVEWWSDSMVAAHYFFPSYSWFRFCVGNVDHVDMKWNKGEKCIWVDITTNNHIEQIGFQAKKYLEMNNNLCLDIVLRNHKPSKLKKMKCCNFIVFFECSSAHEATWNKMHLDQL